MQNNKKWKPKENGWKTPAQRATIKIDIGEDFQPLKRINHVIAKD